MNLLPYLEKGFSYAQYLDLVKIQMQKMEEEGDPKGYVQYYSLGLTRMERLYKSFQLSDSQKEILKGIEPDFEILSISEGWCGDASQILPLIEIIAHQIGIKHKIVFRDENPELMDQYLTDGAKSIPIIIGVSNQGNEIFRFGPRPNYGMELLKKHKENPEVYSADQFHKDLQVWYNQDKGESIFKELVKAIKD